MNSIHSPRPIRVTVTAAVVAFLLLAACGGEGQRTDAPDAAPVTTATTGSVVVETIAPTSVTTATTAKTSAAGLEQGLADIDRALLELDQQLTDADRDVATPEGDLR